MNNDIVEVIQERLKMLHERELLCADECRALRLLVEEIKQQYIKMPLDADGVPIRPGEKLTFEMNDPGMCTGYDFLFSEGKWMLVIRDNDGHGGCRFIGADNAHHVKPDTVESLLEEFHDKLWSDDEEQMALLEEYAKRIRKAVEQ